MAAGDGLISMKPTSIVHAGTSASINADGGVDFTAVTSLSLNGVFTAEYDNYLISMIVNVSSGDAWVRMRLRASGTDTSGTNYVSQTIKASGSTFSGTRLTSLDNMYVSVVSTAQNGLNVHVYGPALAQPTAFRGIGVGSVGGATIEEAASTHSLSTVYDGFTISGSTFTGNIHVFGYEE